MIPFLMLIGGLGDPTPQQSGLYHVRPGQQLTVQVELEQPDGVLVNRLAPTRLSLSTPFKTLELGPDALTGQQADLEPETYFARVDPLKFSFKVPATVKKGSHPLNLQAEVFLCNEQQGLCYTRKIQVQGELKVGGVGKDQPMTVKLPSK